MFSHVTIATEGRHVLFADDAALLGGVRALVRAGGPRLLLFCIVDDHAHLVVEGDGSRLAQALGHSLTGAGAAPRQRAHIKPIDGRTHLESLVRYVARQPAKHGIGGHPALWPGSCVQDLLGVRIVTGFDPSRIAHALPRRNVAHLVAVECSVWDGARRIASPAELAAYAPSSLWDEAHAMIGVTPSSASRSDVVVAARVAWAHAIAGPYREVAAPLELPDRTFRRLRATPPDPAVSATLARRIALQSWVAKCRAPTP